MSWFARVEQSIADFVERAFARNFPSDLEPAQIARKLVAVMEAQTRGDGEGGSSAPSIYEARISQGDFDRLEEHREYLERQWAELLEECARGVGVSFADGPPQVHMIALESLPSGTVEIRAEGDANADEYLPPRFFMHMVRGAPAYGVFALGENTVIGRSESADVFLLDPGISRVHARIEIRDGIATIADCGSTNGTFVNQERIERCVLCDGDSVSFGDTELRVEIRD